jgi:hypothetical protein
MNKHNLLKRIASVATELDYVGLTKEAKTMDLILLKLAQSPVAAPGSDDDGNDDIEFQSADDGNDDIEFQADDDKAFSPEKWSKIRNLIKSIYESIKSVSYMQERSFFEKVYEYLSNKGISEKAIERDMMYLQRWKELLINTEMILSKMNTEYEDAFFKDFNELFQTWKVGYSEVMEYGGPEFLNTKKLKQVERNMQISSKLNDIAEIISWDNVDLLPWEENPELKKEMPFFNS